MKKNIIEEIIEKGKSKQIISAVKEELENGTDPVSLINLMTEAMKTVGYNFQNGSIQISDMFSSAQTMKKGIKFVTQFIPGKSGEYIGTAVVGMAKGDLHDIGKGLVVTKLNNVLFDKETGEGLCVIDLDTVMPGSVLFDFGDALRFGASSGSEDETDLDKIWFDLEKFEQFAKGFLSQTADCLTDAEIELLPLSALLLTYECGIRFLADYLNGDTYFKIHRENHNLDRCRTQFKLVADIEKKLPQMAEIVKKYI